MATGLENIEGAIKTLIESMTIAGTFNFDWGTSNQPDAALNDKFPNALILILSEENDDPLGGSHSQAYSNEVNFQIVVRGKMTAINTVPNFSMNTEHNKALVDLKTLFGKNQDINDTANSILYQSMTRNISGSGDMFRPGDMITEWLVRYSQDRINPLVNAN